MLSSRKRNGAAGRRRASGPLGARSAWAAAVLALTLLWLLLVYRLTARAGDGGRRDAREAPPTRLAGTVCVVVGEEDARPPASARVHQLGAVLARAQAVSLLAAVATGAPGAAESVSAALGDVATEALPDPAFPLDVEPAAKDASRVAAWIADVRCDTVVVLAPRLAHYAALLRRQRASDALSGTPIVAVLAASATDYQLRGAKVGPASVDELGADFAEASALGAVDLVVPEARGAEIGLEKMRRIHAPPQLGASVLPHMPLPASKAAHRVATTVVPVPARLKTIVLWAPDTPAGTLTRAHVLDGVLNGGAGTGSAMQGLGAVSVEVVARSEGVLTDTALHGGRTLPQPFGEWAAERGWSLVVGLELEEALARVKRKDHVVAVPPTPDGVPDAASVRIVVECRAARVPVLAPAPVMDAAGASGGYEPTIDGMRSALREAAHVGVTPLLLPQEGHDDAHGARWTDAFAALPKHVPPAPAERRAALPVVTVCLVHRNRPLLLGMAIESVLAQDYKGPLDVVVIDNGSDPEPLAEVQRVVDAAPPGRAPRLLRLPKLVSLGEARNAAAKAARSEWLLFMDDDNYAKRDEVSVLVRAARATGAAVLAPGDVYLHGSGRPDPHEPPPGVWLPLGASLASGVFRDVFGDANALVRKDVFDAVGGFSGDAVPGAVAGQHSTGEDWELWAQIALAGHDVLPVPVPLFWYRVVPGGSAFARTSRALYRERTLRPFLSEWPDTVEPVVRLARATADLRNAEHLRDTERLSHSVALFRAMMCASVAAEESVQDESGVNLVHNPSFDSGSSGSAQEWEAFGEGYEWFTPGDGYLHTAAGGSYTRVLGATQHVTLPEPSAAPLLLAVRSRAHVPRSDVQDAGFSLYADVTFADGSWQYGVALPLRVTKAWMWQEAVYVPRAPVESLDVFCLFRFRAGSAWWDDVTVRPLRASEVCSADDDNDAHDADDAEKAGARWRPGAPVLGLGPADA